jgi:hypothetical protein
MKARDILYLKLRYSFEPSTGGSYMEGFDCYTQFTIDVYGCDSADLDQDTKEVGSDVFVLSRISDE